MGKLYVIGVGSGTIEEMTIRADRMIRESDFVYCDIMMYEKIKQYYDESKMVPNEYTATFSRCIQAIHSAKDHTVSILGSGDTGIYGIASIILDQVDAIDSSIEVEIVPGLTSAITGGALLGAPLMQDFAIVSLSDHLADKSQLSQKITLLAQSNMGIVFYSPCNPTNQNLQMAREILMSVREKDTIVGIANNIGMPNQNVVITNLEEMNLDEIHSFSTVFIGNDTTHVTKMKKMVTKLYK